MSSPAFEEATAGNSSVEAPPRGDRWPHQLSIEPIMRVSDVIGHLKGEFPALSASKLRYLDTEGVVSPHRTEAGYRLYSPQDFERLRYVLRQQRDHYRPLSVIVTQLGALDAGETRESLQPSTAVEAASQWVSSRELATLAQVDEPLVTQLVDAGIIVPSGAGGLSRRLVPLVSAAGAYVHAGGDLRAMRTLRNAAVREASTAGALAATVADPEARAARAQVFASAATELFESLVRANIDDR